jgi:hypothetical protein
MGGSIGTRRDGKRLTCGIRRDGRDLLGARAEGLADACQIDNLEVQCVEA